MRLQGALVVGLISLAFVSGPGMAQQIVLDTTLGPDSSQVLPVGDTDFILGGLESDINLFHSFEEFGIASGRAATFVSQNRAIENIFARVTGAERSEIFGTLGTIGFFDGEFVPADANLFLINPNGILFADNAQLSINGSFWGTTATGIRFQEQYDFDTIDPEPPILLSVAPSSFLFESESIKNIKIDASGSSSPFISVPSNHKITLLGGNISLNGGVIAAFGGQVELGALAEPSEILIQGDKLFIPEKLELANITLSNAATIATAISGINNGGDLSIIGNNFYASEGSVVLAGILPGSGLTESTAGKVTVDLRGELRLEQGSQIANQISENSSGNGGDLQVRAENLVLNDGSFISTSTFGQGNAGDLNIIIQDSANLNGFRLSGSPSGISPSGVFSSVETGAVGNAGNLQFSANQLEVTNGANVSAGSFGQGNAGNMKVTIEDEIRLEGLALGGFPSRISNFIGAGAVGDSGILQVSAGNLNISNGATISSLTSGQGQAGNIIIRVQDEAYFDGRDSGRGVTGIFSSVESSGVGKGGKLDFSAEDLTIVNGATISASTLGRGGAGELAVNVGDRIVLDGVSSSGFQSSIINRVFSSAVGDGGDIQLSARELEILNGGAVNAGTSGQGNGGKLDITIKGHARIDGTTPFEIGDANVGPSSISSTVESSAVGNANTVRVNVGSLEVTNGAVISASTFGRGNAGDLNIKVQSNAVLDGFVIFDPQFVSGIFTFIAPDAIGSAAQLDFSAKNLSVTNGAAISASALGKGRASQVIVNVEHQISLDGSTPLVNDRDTRGFSGITSIALSEALGKSGDVQIVTDILEIINGAGISASSAGDEGAGDIVVRARERISLISSPESNQSFINVTSTGLGKAGNLQLSAPTIRLENSEIIAESTGDDGGNILIDNRANSNLTIDSFPATSKATIIRRNSLISTTAGNNQNPGNGGNVTINTPFLISLPNENSDIIANAFEGTGGNITINSDAILNFQLQDEPNVNALRSNTTNDISASSAIGSSGILNLAGLNVDPARGSAQLPVAPTSPNQVDRTCSTQTTNQNSFTITGRGGIPLSPDDFPTRDRLPMPWLSLDEADPAELAESTETIERSQPTFTKATTPQPTQPLQEASQWQRDRQGKVQLIATAPIPRPITSCSVATTN